KLIARKHQGIRGKHARVLDPLVSDLAPFRRDALMEQRADDAFHWYEPLDEQLYLLQLTAIGSRKAPVEDLEIRPERQDAFFDKQRERRRKLIAQRDDGAHRVLLLRVLQVDEREGSDIALQIVAAEQPFHTAEAVVQPDEIESPIELQIV